MKEDPIEKDGFVRTHRDDTRYAQFAQDIFDLDLLLRETHARRYKESRQGPRSQFEERLAERIQRDRILTEDSVRHAIRLVDDYTKELEGTKKGNSIDNILRKITVHTRIVGNNDISSADVALRKLPHMAYQLSDVDLTRWTLIGSHNSAEDKISYFSLDEWAKTVCIGLNTAKVGMENYEKSPHQRFAVKTEAEIRNNLAGIISLQGIRGVSEELMDSITGRPFHDDEKVTALQVYAHMLKIIGAENRNLPKTAYLGTAEVVAWTADTNPMDALIWSYIGLRLSNSEREEYFKL
ncbi:hypothetical protein HOC32_00775, partial [Candidatus Woesearchaeota archaeon]|nr:hypothetical protein [Candidatus Woesearchaeota archaeon]